MMDKSRQQFEEYFLKKPQNHIDSLKKDQFGYYYYHVTREVWDVWQASRESLAIELPEPFIANENCETWCYDEDLVNQILISNGVKIKNE